MPMRNRLYQTELIWCVPSFNSILAVAILTFVLSFAEVQTGHMALPPLHYPPPCLPIYLRRMVLISLSVLVVP
jgi:hypothetical protein